MPHSSDSRFTPWGELESEIFWKFNLVHLNYIPEECGRYSAVFDEHKKLKYSYFYHKEKRLGCYEEMTKFEERSYDYTYNDEGRIIRQTEKHKSNFWEHLTEREFDGQGRIIKETYDKDYKQIIYTYNGNLLASKNDVHLYNEVYKYDAQGNRIELLRTDYFDNGVCHEKSWYNKDGVMIKNIREHKSPSSNSIIRNILKGNTWFFISVNNKPEERKIIYHVTVLDEHGNAIKESRQSRTATLDEQTGKWKTEHYAHTYSYKYIYDKYGNWIRKEYQSKESLFFVTREIEYYE